VTKKFPAFIKPEGSLPCSQDFVRLHPTMSQLNPFHILSLYLFKMDLHYPYVYASSVALHKHFGTNTLFAGEISGSRSGEYEDDYLL
jgi:hypothetical protein